MTKETELLLADVVAKALTPVAAKEDSNLAIGDMAKAISAIADKVDTLSSSVVMKEVETPEDKIEALTKTVGSLAEVVTKLASGETIEKEAELPKTPAELNALIAKAVKSAVEGEEEPDGEGSDTDLEKSLKNKDSEKVEKDIDLSSIEKVDRAGNVLTDEKRIARKSLDDYFLQKISPVASDKE